MLAAASAPEPVEGLALHEIARGGCASEVAERTGRHPQTVMGWLHRYNEGGPETVRYRRTGAVPPLPGDPGRARCGGLRCSARGGRAARSRRRPEAALDAQAAGRVCAGAVCPSVLPRDHPRRPAPARPVVEEGQEAV